MKFSDVFVAGTFDGLHRGHESFLSKAFSLGSSVTIGLTSDAFVKKYKPHVMVKSFTQRKKALEEWLTQHAVLKRANIVAIHDPIEPAASTQKTGALLITADNRKRGEEINAIRKKRNLPAFTLVSVPLVKAQDQKPISSTRMRKGEIDTEGRLVLPDNLRPQLQQPLGLVLHGEMIAPSLAEHKESIIVTVGDVATKTLLDGGVTPALIVIDNKVERKPYKGLTKWRKTLLAHTHKVQSGPGFIAKDAIDLFRQWAKRPRIPFVIEVSGEEDLLTLSAIAEAPVGSIVYYGQPPIAAWVCGPIVQGLVEVEVTEDVKRQTKKLLTQFEQ